MSRPAVRSMADRLTTPFGPGADSLALELTGTSPASAAVVPYDFSAHLGLYGSMPARPTYVVIALLDVTVDSTLTVDYDPGGHVAAPLTSRHITVLAGTPAGWSSVLDLDADGGPGLRLTRLNVLTGPEASPPPARAAWKILALLGNTARLLWVVGVESDLIRAQMTRVLAQRHLSSAPGAGASGDALDRIGSDLGVPRFPPRAYTFQDGTLALYHLDDGTGADAMRTTYDAPGHDAVDDGTPPVPSPGRFGNGLAFRVPQAVLQAPDHPDFALPAGRSFTVDCFVKPDRAPSTSQPSAVAWHVVAKHPDPSGAPAKAGWALSVGRFGPNVPGNVRFLLSDGVAAPVVLFADIDLSADGLFHHVAGVIDRQAASGRSHARLYVDGRLVRVGALPDSLGALTTDSTLSADQRALRIGLGPAPGARGILDEVRLSSVARSSFAPVLGEDDDSYRLRLRLFRPWTLPTAGALQDRINQAVGPPLVNDPTRDLNPLVVSDRNVAILGGSRAVTLGTPPAPSATPARPSIQVGSPGAALDGNILPRSNATAGDTALPLPGFDLNVDQSVQLTVPGLGEAFYLQQQEDGWVPVLSRPTSGAYATVPAGTLFQYRWTLIPAGAGRAHPAARNGSPSLDQPELLLTATAPGELVVKAELSWAVSDDPVRRSRTLECQATIRIGLDRLDVGHSVAADGTMDVADDVAGEPDPRSFEASASLPNYLVTASDGRAAFGTLDDRRMQPATASALIRLLDLVGMASLPQPLTVVGGFDPTPHSPPTFENVGRGLTLSHPGLDASRLGAMALAAGFTVTRVHPPGGAGAPIEVRQQGDDLVTISDPGAIGTGEERMLEVAPRAGPAAASIAGNRLFVGNALSDTVSEIDPATGTGAVLGAFKVGWGPLAVAVRPEGGSTPSPRRLFTADAKGGTVTSVSLEGAPGPRQIAVAAGPVALAVTAAWVFVACRDGGQLTRLDAADVPSAPRLDTPVPQPSAVAATPDGAFVWVAVPPEQAVRVYSVATAALTLAATIPLPDAPSGLVMAADGRRAFASLPATGRIAVLDVDGKALARTVAVPPVLGAPARPDALAVVDRGPAGLTLAAADASPRNPQVHLLDAGPTGFALTHRASLATGVAAAALTSGTFSIKGEAGGKSVPWLLAALPDGDRVAVIDPAAATLVFIWGLGTGLGELLSWAVQPPDAATLSSTTAPRVTATAKVAGPAQFRAAYTLPPSPGSGVAPYTFEARLKPSLEAATPRVVLRKEQYDRVMNVLNAFHPIGVEVLTAGIRERVTELKDDQSDVLPEYTFPNFRVRVRAPRRYPQE